MVSGSSRSSQHSMMSSSEQEKRPNKKRSWNRRCSSAHTIADDQTSEPSNDEQLHNLAFNIHGWALEDGMVGRSAFEVINANKATMYPGGFEAKIDQLIRDAKGHAQIYRSSNRYTAREMDSNLPKHDSCVVPYLIIGYMLQHDDPLYIGDQYKSRNSEGELVGQTAPAPEYILRWNACKTPVLVVTPLKRNIGTSVRMFALITQRSGLCLPVLVTHERIFYRWEFRTNTGVRPQQRNKNWNQYVIYMALKCLPGNENVTFRDAQKSKQIKLEDEEVPKRATGKPSPTMEVIKNEQKLDFETFNLDLNLDGDLLHQLTVQNDYQVESRHQINSKIQFQLVDADAQAVLKHIRNTSSKRLLAESENLLLDLERSDTSNRLQRSSLLKLSNDPSDFTLRDADNAARDLGILWPALADTAEVATVLRIKSLLHLTSSWYSLTYEGVMRFFRSALHKISSEPDVDDVELAKLVVAASWGPSKVENETGNDSHIELKIGDDAVLLLSLLEKMVVINAWQISCGLAIHACRLTVPLSLVGHDMRYSVDLKLEDARRDIHNIAFNLLVHANRHGDAVRTVQDMLVNLRRVIQEL